MNCYTYNEDGNSITGLLQDSSWFKLYIENNNLMLNLSGKKEKIEYNYFYIFGMGLREKYIYSRWKAYRIF